MSRYHCGEVFAREFQNALTLELSGIPEHHSRVVMLRAAGSLNRPFSPPPRTISSLMISPQIESCGVVAVVDALRLPLLCASGLDIASSNTILCSQLCKNV